MIHPRPGGGLTSVKAGLHTVYGQVGSAWTVADGKFTYDQTIPANASATVTLPTGEVAGITESGKPLGEVKEAVVTSVTEGGVSFTLGAGTYRFVCPLMK